MERMVQLVKKFAGDATTTSGIASNIMYGMMMQCMVDYIQPNYKARKESHKGPKWDVEEAGMVKLKGKDREVHAGDCFRAWFEDREPHVVVHAVYEHDQGEVCDACIEHTV